MPTKAEPDFWITDGNDQIKFSIRHQGDRLFAQQSSYQLVEVFKTEVYGRVLTVDGMVMCSEKDEYAYHEMIVHIPVLAHGNVKDVLVIGGGDGGTIREVLRHPEIESVTMVEIDEVVIKAACECLPTLSTAFKDSKLKLIIGDGVEYIKNAQGNSFDLIIIDSSDPVGPAEGLFNIKFYKGVNRCLRSDGVMTAQSESPWFHQAAFIDLNQCLQTVFGRNRTYPYLTFIPTYPTGMWSFIYATKSDKHPWKNVDGDRAQAFTEQAGLQYYNPKLQEAAFCLPTFVQNLLNH